MGWRTDLWWYSDRDGIGARMETENAAYTLIA